MLFDNDKTIDKLTFTAKAVGTLSIEKSKDQFIHMTFPNQEPQMIKYSPKEFLNGLSIQPKKILRNEQAYFAIYDNEEDVYNIKLDFGEIKKLKPYNLVVSAKGEKYDFVSRYFWPASGGNEDFVTGSIHTGLAPYWSKILNKKQLLAYQASSRGGVLRCEIKENKVIISGKAILYLQGHINVPIQGIDNDI
ncbi:PhzF family phenazine biosynthesis protein [Sulfurospirillum sp.]|nr:PhzF family phenazine biosynthesis protein [Sulfurospirillum sp.]